MKFKRPVCIKDGHKLRFFTREKPKDKPAVAIYACPFCMTLHVAKAGNRVEILELSKNK